jgi:hypothetical protein
MTIRLSSRRSLATMLAVVGMGCVFLGAPRSASAQSDPSPEAFLTAIYSTYKGSSDKGAKGIPLNNDETIQRYFEPSLASEIIKDAAEAKTRGDAPKLNGDPFIDGQDWEITKFSVAVKDAGGDKAVGTVNINNFGKDIAIVLNLVKPADGWRIANISWETGDTLRSLYFKNEPGPKGAKKPPSKAKKKPPPKGAKKPPRRSQRS